MKNINKLFSMLAISGVVALTSCESDDNTGASMVDFQGGMATLSTDQDTYTFSEKEIDEEDPSTYTIPVTVTLDESYPVNTVIDFVLASGGDAGDFTASTITVPARQTMATGTIQLIQNGTIEGDETLVIEARSRANVDLNPFSVTVNIVDDYVNDVLELTIDWSGSYTEEVGAETTTYDFCGLDFDLLILDETMSDTGLYDAATASCPEHIDLSGLPDGTYYLYLSLYENTFEDAPNVDVPVTISYTQEYFESGEMVIDYYSLDSAPEDIIVGTIEVENGYMYTVTPL